METNHGPWKGGNSAERDQKSIRPREYHTGNECAHQVWDQYPEQFVWKCMETAQPMLGNCMKLPAYYHNKCVHHVHWCFRADHPEMRGNQIRTDMRWSQSWSWMTYSHPLCLFNVNQPSHSATYSYFKIWPWKSLINAMCVVKGLGHIRPWKLKDQGHCQGQIWWLHLRPNVQSICLLFVLWQSDHLGLRYSKFHVWSWKFKAKVMAKVKPDSHIWGPVFNPCLLFFRGNRTIFGWDIANSIFDLENSRSRSRRKSTKI